MNEVFNTLKKLIDDIQSIYTEINNEWFLKKCTKLNLKKCQVADIDIDGTIYKNVMDYIQFLNEHSSNIILLLSCTCSYSVTSRVKAQNSISIGRVPRP